MFLDVCGGKNANYNKYIKLLYLLITIFYCQMRDNIFGWFYFWNKESIADFLVDFYFISLVFFHLRYPSWTLKPLVKEYFLPRIPPTKQSQQKLYWFRVTFFTNILYKLYYYPFPLCQLIRTRGA
ncbi:hypothetical protein DRJ00_08790 [Candidatus Aerophobetes bacterium]|uniref:Uncharacterized protein n=1 Tax=Aerophobetes bacterium TaxID=2030807 RepID=A0A497E193_UNCAE|nr:MAG: hypothetical protein DRJ00_08790 [Candidatus Aerophobetes bacterium]